MIRSAFILLTAIAVLWHATAGCCAHHAHAASPAESNETASCCGHDHACAAEKSHGHDGCEEKRKATDDGFAAIGEAGDSAHGHCGERCSFPQPEGSGVALVQRTLDACDLAFPIATVLFAVEAPQAEALPACESPPPPQDGAALRRHLALGVLLI